MLSAAQHFVLGCLRQHTSHSANKTVLYSTPYLSKYSTLYKQNLPSRTVAFCTTTHTMAMDSVTYLDQRSAIQLDEDLMDPDTNAYSINQLMELAGLAVAQALAHAYPVHVSSTVLVIAGPGNNGGDGLVAARHLTLFGYKVSVCYPKQTQKPLYKELVTQCKQMGVTFVDTKDVPLIIQSIKQHKGSTGSESSTVQYNGVILDAMFGFSFKGAPRPPFNTILELLTPEQAPPPIISIDIPSGWDVETGPPQPPTPALSPDTLISLTTPKLCAKHFKGQYHFLGGRFVPPNIASKYNLTLPPYPGFQQFVELPAPGAPQAPAAPVADTDPLQGMRQDYKYGVLEEGYVEPDPFTQFEVWLQEATEQMADGRGAGYEPNAVVVSSVGDSGQPSSRVVLLKGLDKGEGEGQEGGFVFYTNLNSRKGQELINGKGGSMCFYWGGLQRQVRIEGHVQHVPPDQSTEYFNTRPRGSQIGAWASEQSSVLRGGRDELEARFAEFSDKYSGDAVVIPRPEHWGGIKIVPSRIEFWQGRSSRLHDRLSYKKTEAGGKVEWEIERLAP